MSNKTNIEEDVKILKRIEVIGFNTNNIYDNVEKVNIALKNVLEDRDNKLKKVGRLEKLLTEQEEVIIDKNNKICSLEFKANKYDSLVDKIKDKIKELKKHRDLSTYGFGKLEVLQELLDTEQIKKEV